MSDESKKAQESLVHFRKQELAKRSDGLVKRGLNQLLERETRVVRFPENFSIGTIVAVPKIHAKTWWKIISQFPAGVWFEMMPYLSIYSVRLAQGEKIYPADLNLILSLRGSDQEDISFDQAYLSLLLLAPNDLMGLDLKQLDGHGLVESQRGILQRLSGLNWLKLPRGYISEWSFLSNLPNLTWLDMSFCFYEGDVPFHALKKLRYLDLSFAKYLDLDCLTSLADLETLYIPHTKLINIYSLKKLKKLKILDLSGIELYETSLDEEFEVERLRAAMPLCKIYF